MIKKYIIAGTIGLMAVLPAISQNTYSGYFLDNFLYRHQMNPAMGNDNNFLGFPTLGNVSVGMEGTIHLSKILYNYNGKTVLFTNPNLAPGTVGEFPDKNKLGASIRDNIINFGFKGLGGYNTVGINFVTNTQIAAPGSLFNLLRDGVENKTYDIKNFNIYANAYAEIALNHSRDIAAVPGLRVGATFKFIVGGGNIYGRFQKAHLTLGEESWDIVSNADIYASVKGVKYKLDTNNDVNPPRKYVNGIDFDNISGPNGYGAAVDLGATYKWNDFNFSLAILDLGGIAWNETQHASTDGDQYFQTSDYTFNVNDGDATWDEIKNDISSLYQLKDMGDSGKRSTMLGTTMNIGVEYCLPYWRGLTFGLLNTTRMTGGYTWTEFRLSANVMPVKYISASANLVCGTYGVGFGWLLNVSTGKGFNLFLGMDRTPGKLAKQYAPLNSNANFNFGINFPF